MAEAESPERLPVGWTEQVAAKDGEQVKFYYNVITGQKAYSKADLPRYVELGSPFQGTRQQTHAQKEDNPENKVLQIPEETNDTPDWLPQGWIIVLNATSNGSKYKRYIDPTTGRKFNSKPEILRYLNSDKGNDPTSKQTAMSIGSESNPRVDESSVTETPQKMEGSQTLKGTSSKPSQKEKRSSNSPQKKVEIVRCAAEGLPPGWIKEIKIERNGNKTRKDPYYTDPDSKYVFRSHPDAFRYLETKDPRLCAIKPRKREELEFLNDEMSISEEQQSVDNTTEKCTTNEENHAPSCGQPPRTPVSKRKRGRPVAAPSTDNITRREKPAEIILDSKSEVASLPCRSST